MHAQVTIRPYSESDKDFVMSTWLRGQYWGSDHYKEMNQDAYFKSYAEYVQILLTLPGTTILVAALDGDPMDIRGYVVFNGPVIYWGYVKKEYRSKGIFNLLISDHTFESAISLTKNGLRVMKKKKITFHPFRSV